MRELPDDIDVDDIKAVEKDFKFLGVSGVEDLLQDNVAECIRDFKQANIKVWMLTGDKGETAKEIGYACALFDQGENFEIFHIEDDEKSLEEKFKLFSK